jgi:hypothetical protein
MNDKNLHSYITLEPSEFYRRVTNLDINEINLKTVLDGIKYLYLTNSSIKCIYYWDNRWEEWSVINSIEFDKRFKNVLRREKLTKIRNKI